MRGALLVLLLAFAPGDEDCDDADPTTWPRAEEIGDLGDGGFNEGVVANLVNSWSPAYIVTVGDDDYPDGSFWTIEFNIGCFCSFYIGNYQGFCGTG